MKEMVLQQKAPAKEEIHWRGDAVTVCRRTALMSPEEKPSWLMDKHSQQSIPQRRSLLTCGPVSEAKVITIPIVAIIRAAETVTARNTLRIKAK